MFQVVIEMMSHTFIQRAVLVGTLVSLCAALLGVSLVLKRYSMIGDGLSHVGFGILTVATAFGFISPLYISIPCVVICAIIICFMAYYINRLLADRDSLACLTTDQSAMIEEIMSVSR